MAAGIVVVTTRIALRDQLGSELARKGKLDRSGGASDGRSLRTAPASLEGVS